MNTSIILLLVFSVLCISAAHLINLLFSIRDHTLYVIKKGHHYSQWMMPKIFQLSTKNEIKHLSFTARIHGDTLAYWIPGPDQMDINKLYGYSLGWNHHKNSIRIGWRFVPSEYEGDYVEFLAYWYDGGERNFLSLKKIQVKGIISKDIKLDFDMCTTRVQHIIHYGDAVLSIPRLNKRDYMFGYKLRPYFGGNHKAHRDIKIDIWER